MLVDGERMHSESEGMLIDTDSEIDVVGVDGARLIVRLASLLEVDSETVVQKIPAPEISESEQKPDPLDFDIPQS